MIREEAIPGYESDPAGTGAIVGAVHWLEGALLGSVAVSIAVISVAAVGLMMLSGRIDVRRSATVILGCFILFGAPAIAAGIESMVLGVSEPADAPATFEPPPLRIEPPPPAPPPQPPASSDPFAGAAVPAR
ncbi:MAG: TrbC/VirB2 family protein [Allosphingosinicella sp.]